MARARKPAPDPVNGNGNLLPPVAVTDSEKEDSHLGAMVSKLRDEVFDLEKLYAGKSTPEPRTPLVFSAIRNVMKDIVPLAKTHEHENQGFFFRTMDEVAARLQPLFVEHALFITPELLEENEVERAVSAAGESFAQFFTKVRVKWHVFSAIDGSELPAPCVTMGEGMSDQHFSTAAAQTMAYKQMLWQTFMIPVFGNADPESIVGERSQVSVQPSAAHEPVHTGNLFGDEVAVVPKAKRQRRAPEPQVVTAGTQEAATTAALDATPTPSQEPLTKGHQTILKSTLSIKGVSEEDLFAHLKVDGFGAMVRSDMDAAMAFLHAKG